MRKLAAAILAVPVILALYASIALRHAPTIARRPVALRRPSALRGISTAIRRLDALRGISTAIRRPVPLRRTPVVLRRSVVARAGIAVGIAGLVGVVALGASPRGTVATPPASAIVPLTPASFSSTIAAKTPLNAPISVSFSAPMDPASVAASLEVTPKTAVTLSWDASRTKLTVAPRGNWAAATYYTISVRAGALGQSGRPMTVPARALFTTRPATTAHVEATKQTGKRAKLTTAFRLTFDGDVAVGDVRKGLVTSPVIRGSLDKVASADGTSSFLFTPSEPLAPGTRYSVALVDVSDADGVPVTGDTTITVATTDAPRIVRFRPADGTKKVERTAVLSVRFSESMNKKTTKAALRVTAGGSIVAGTVTFAEKNTVLVFTPKSKLPYGAKVELSIAASATSAAGAPLDKSRTIGIRVEAKPKPVAVARTSSTRISKSGGSVGGGSWGAVESYYLRLMNCTRTGGWVTSTGSCSSPGGRSVAPLKLDAGISSKVSRPYAKRLAVNNQCSHFIGGNPGDRLRAAGYSSYIWAENLGCRSGNPYSAVLGSHLFFQSEKSYNGGHYVNMMNAKYDRAGIGVWVSGGRVRLVIDFYHPR